MSPEFIGAVEYLPDVAYFVQVTKSTRVWLRRPMMITRQYRWGGKTRTKTIKTDAESDPLRLDEPAANISNYFWYRHKVSEGTKGPIAYEFTHMHDGPFLHLAPENQDGKKAPSITLSQLRMFLKLLLPLKKHNPETMIQEVIGIQARNHRAYRSHRKRREREPGQYV